MGSHGTKDLDSPMPMSRSKTTASALCSEFSRFFPEWQVCFARFVEEICDLLLESDACKLERPFKMDHLWGQMFQTTGDFKRHSVGHAIHVFTAALNQSDLSGLPKITPKALTELGKHPGKSHYCQLWFFNPMYKVLTARKKAVQYSSLYLPHKFWLWDLHTLICFFALGEAERFVISGCYTRIITTTSQSSLQQLVKMRNTEMANWLAGHSNQPGCKGFKHSSEAILDPCRYLSLFSRYQQCAFSSSTSEFTETSEQRWSAVWWCVWA